jgi:hypothetical protein
MLAKFIPFSIGRKLSSLESLAEGQHSWEGHGWGELSDHLGQALSWGLYSILIVLGQKAFIVSISSGKMC